jgi:hypothetical protein
MGNRNEEFMSICRHCHGTCPEKRGSTVRHSFLPSDYVMTSAWKMYDNQPGNVIFEGATEIMKRMVKIIFS